MTRNLAPERELYPELTDDEYQRTIRPLRRRETTALATAPGPEPLLAAPRFGADHETFTFQTVCEALAQRAWNASALHADGIGALEAVQVRSLALEVFNMSIRPLADDMRDFCAEGAATYDDYCASLLCDGFASFAGAYPVLWTRLQLRLAQKVRGLAELSARLATDRVAIERSIGIGSDAQVSAVDASGDTHGGGRAVAVVTFETGERLVYKPRPVDCEAAWSRLAEWLRGRYGLRINGLTVIDRGTYGYVKYVDRLVGSMPAFTEVGQLAGVLYLLKARDMHFSNIHGTDAGPVAIDLETLLHPPRQKSTGLLESRDSAYRILGESVYGTGILPLVVTKRGALGAVDIGFAGGGEVRGRSPFRSFRLEREFTADLRVVWDRGDADEPQSAPAITAEDARDVTRRCAEMVDGFRTAYRAVAADAGAFGAQVHEQFADCRVRYIHNPTIRYDQALRSLTGTQASADGGLADGLVKRVAIASPAASRELVESECQQLWDTDVPYFLVPARDTAILDAGGSVVVRDAFEHTPLDEVDRGLAALSDADLQRQVTLIRMAFNAKLPDPHVMGEVVELHEAGAARNEAADDERLRSLAITLADSLVDTMVEDRYPHLPRTWIGPVASAEQHQPWSPGVLGYDLYTGRVGPALALAALSSILPAGSDHGTAAKAVFTPIAEILNDRTFETRSITQAGIGAYNGFAGTTWALAVAARLLDRPDYAEAATAATAFLAGEAAGAGWFDGIGGGTGAELVLLEVVPDSPGLHARIDRSCRAALQHAVADSMEYSGLAHGVAGVMRYAARAAGGTELSSARELYETSHAALVRRFFVDDERGFRTNASGEENFSDSWCNGAAGVMLAISEGVAAGLCAGDELSGLIERLRRDPVSQNLTLCHGILGLREVARAVAGRLDDHPAAAALDADLLGYLGPDVIAAGAFDDGSRYSTSTSLMAGRAGVVLHLHNRLRRDGVLVAPLTLDLETP